MVPKLRNSVSIAVARSWFHIAYSVGSLGREDEHVDVQPVVDEIGDQALRLACPRACACTCVWTPSAVDSWPPAAAANSVASGIVPQRKYERRLAIW